MSDNTETAAQPVKKTRKWPWVVAAIFLVGWVAGQFLPPTVHDMTCIELNDEMDEIRAANTEGGTLQPFTYWDQDDLDRMRELIDEVTDRQNGPPQDFCALRTN